MIKLHSIKGVSSIGANMVAYEIDSEIIIVDMGIDSIRYSFEGDGLSKEDLVDIGILPDISKLDKEKVKAIVLTSADPNHMGGVEFLAGEFTCPIYGSKYAIDLLRKTQNIEGLNNKIMYLKPNSPFKLLDTQGIAIEMVNTTYSVPHSCMVAIHTPKDKVILHTGSFKFDNRPAIGMKTNFNKLKELKEIGINVLSLDALRSNDTHKTMSEILVKEMIRDTFIETDIVDTKGIIITLTPTHMTRLKSVVDLSVESRREVFILGEFKNYIDSAQEIGLVDYNKKGITIENDPNKVKELISKAAKNKDKYVLIVDGCQGEPGKILTEIVHGKTDYKLDENDKVVFSCSNIPNEQLAQFRSEIMSKLNASRCKVFSDMHVSGHATRSDLKDLITMVKPQKIVPMQGDIRIKQGLIEVCEELGIEEDEGLILATDGSSVEL